MRRPPAVSPDTPVRDVVSAMERLNLGCVLVIDQQHWLGLLTERDILRAIASGADLYTCSVGDYMRPAEITLLDTELSHLPTVLHTLRQCRDGYVPVLDSNRRIMGILSVQDALVAMEAAFLRSESKLSDILDSAIAVITSLRVYDAHLWEYEYRSAGCEVVFGFTTQELLENPTLWQSRVEPDDWEQTLVPAFNRVLTEKFLTIEYRFRHKDGQIRWIAETATSRRDEGSGCFIVTLVSTDVTRYRRMELALHQQVERSRLLTSITQHIHQSFDLNAILNTTVVEVRQMLQCDRIVVYRFNPDWSGVIVVESVLPPWPAILGANITDPCFTSTYVEPYQGGRVTAIDNIHAASIAPCHVELLSQFSIQANLVVPILQDEDRGWEVAVSAQNRRPRLWGLLIAHECRSPRRWESDDINLLRNVATQVGVALQQAELYRQVQQFNGLLEQQVLERTAELQRSLNFEALLTRIIHRVRDSLNEEYILQTAVRELCLGLGAYCCDTALYDLEKRTSTIRYEYLASQQVPQAQGTIIAMHRFPDVYDRLLEGQLFQGCCLTPPDQVRSTQRPLAGLACPLIDDQGVLGDIWLFRECHQFFDEAEVRLVQHVANQCAIALRQARLYHTSQAQVRELEHLNRLKDDFLSTVSHELRTPMANIKMATEMLEMLLFKSQAEAAQALSGIRESLLDKLTRYFKVLRDECNREISLINDLLDLARLESGREVRMQTQVLLPMLVNNIAATFQERARNQQQRLTIDLPPNLPAFQADLAALERILAELLNNACKYTPPSGLILISARISTTNSLPQAEAEPNPSSFPTRSLLLSVTNTGIEIAESERDRVFEKFYRIPNGDPWKHGGTGLGLALVKKLVDRLGGAIHLESGDGKTTFTLEIPLS